LTNHPLSFVLFGHPTEVAIEEITIKDQNFEYYVEVKAEEVPSKAELVTALASIEETHSALIRNLIKVWETEMGPLYAQCAEIILNINVKVHNIFV